MLCAGAWMLAGEMMVRVFFQVTRKQFRNVKIVFDTSLVLISAIFTGWLMRYFDPLVDLALRGMGSNLFVRCNKS